MKKVLFLTLLVLLTSVSYVSARTQYDSTGRHIIYDDTIRGRQRAAALEEQQKQLRQNAAAAAKIDYDGYSETFEEDKPKSNFYQDSEEFKSKHTVRERPKSNYYQSSEEYKAKHNIQ